MGTDTLRHYEGGQILNTATTASRQMIFPQSTWTHRSWATTGSKDVKTSGASRRIAGGTIFLEHAKSLY